ncbi:MAG: hypothetical protein JWO06_1628 [Bacteroidota bacterium]|nr:hypothetical protein [Bacteroidota bacterium]
MKIFFSIVSVLVLLSAAVVYSNNGVTLIVISTILILLNVLALKAKKSNWMLLVTSVYTIYILAEVFNYGLICADYLRPDWVSITGKTFTATNRPYLRFDSVSGYKYIPGKTRLINIMDGQLIFDHPLQVNNKGYCSFLDYDYRKKNKEQKRIIVFGDSFSAGEIADTTWVDIVNQMLAHDSITSAYQLYNFSLEACGICNWNSTFFNEVVKDYDFDGVLFAVFGSDKNYFSADLARDFSIKNSDEYESNLGFVENLPKNNDDFDKQVKSSLIYTSSIYTDQQIDHYKALALNATGKRVFSFFPPYPYLLHSLTEMISTTRKLKRFRAKYRFSKPVVDKIALERRFDDLGAVENYYGSRKYNMFKSMLEHCRQNTKEIWLASMTSMEVAQALPARYHQNMYNQQLKVFAKAYGAEFIDGYSCLDSISPENYFNSNRYTLPGDSHWNQQGEYLYARLVFEEMKKAIINRNKN